MHFVRALRAGRSARRGQGQEALRRHHARALVAALVGLLVAASPASASKLEVLNDTLAYTAAAGEVNAATLTLVGGNVQVADPGATIEAGAGCSSTDAHTASCSG